VICINGDRLLSALRELATIGKFQTGVDRIAFSDSDVAARRWLVRKLTAAGLKATLDRVGNVLGRAPKAATAVLIGSHTDTVPRGGWLDGALGAIYGLEIARSAIEGGGDHAVDVISFQDEEGTFLPFLGSRSFCGELADSEIAATRARDGCALTDALAALAQEAPPVRLDRARHRCYLEAHIEQGPRLEGAGRRIGVVTSIVGIRRFRLRAHGRADHAGTTPMSMRQDAGTALMWFMKWVAEAFPRLAGPDTVWNIGAIAFRPGAANVVPAEAELTLEFRDARTELLDLLENRVLARVAESAGTPVRLEAERTMQIAPTAMSGELADTLAAAAATLGEEPMRMPSGAGHDAMVVGRVIPAAMLFVPSIGGRSHDISENTSDADIVLGCEVLADAVARLRKG